ncbi:MAG: two-component system sensor histidine kinase NtrB [Thermodesulfobacteriota bacterium]
MNKDPGDMALLRRAESSARHALGVREAILEGIGAAAITIDAQSFTIQDMNSAARQLFGIDRESWRGRPYGELLGRHLTNLSGNSLEMSPGPGNQARTGEFLLRRPDGKLVPVSRTVIHGTADNRKYLFEVLFDISAKKAMERQLGLAQKLESIGLLASGIAHEINTPIQYVGGNLGFLQEAFRELAALIARYEELVAGSGCAQELGGRIEDARRAARLDSLLAEIPDSISDSLAGVERVASIVSAMKRFSHPESAGKRLLDVNKAVESTITISSNEWKYHSEMRTELDPALPPLFCSPGDFNQAVLNVVVNAAHAVSERFQGTDSKGVITVSTFQENGWIAVKVQDTGVGIPKENLDRIFDPFFTTKEVGKGTGQGLAIVHAVVERHGGNISIESVPGQGTVFTLRFPAVREDVR